MDSAVKFVTFAFDAHQFEIVFFWTLLALGIHFTLRLFKR